MTKLVFAFTARHEEVVMPAALTWEQPVMCPRGRESQKMQAKLKHIQHIC